ncbi:MAG: YggT family protein, partial [Gammaproteobacteria bacterium]|nr:YggT family protein [Gammaproteobacteria bacterium]
MGGGYLLNAVVFLVDLVFTLFMIAVLLRFLFQLFRADFFNPIAQALVKITNPVLKPLRKVIPGLFSIDLSAIVLLIIIAIIKTFVVTLINDIVPKIGGVLVLALADCIHLTLNV